MGAGMRLIVFFLFFFLSISFAQLENITAGLTSLCSFLADLLPVISMTLVVAGGAVYAGGQLMGAETRARANVWATSLITGALIGILISVVSPTVIGAMYGPTWDDSCAQGGGGQGGGGDEQLDCGDGQYNPDTQICCNQDTVCLANQHCCPGYSSCYEENQNCPNPI